MHATFHTLERFSSLRGVECTCASLEYGSGHTQPTSPGAEVKASCGISTVFGEAMQMLRPASGTLMALRYNYKCSSACCSSCQPDFSIHLHLQCQCLFRRSRRRCSVCIRNMHLCGRKKSWSDPNAGTHSWLILRQYITKSCQNSKQSSAVQVKWA